jgi:hypothetical protein
MITDCSVESLDQVRELIEGQRISDRRIEYPYDGVMRVRCTLYDPPFLSFDSDDAAVVSFLMDAPLMQPLQVPA